MTTIKKRLNTLDRDLTHPLLAHLQRVVQSVAENANQLAAHCGRKYVNMKDVAQASSALCLTCAPYNDEQNTCSLLTTAPTREQVGGGMPTYIGFCDSNEQQCGASNSAICLFSGGKKKRKNNTKSTRSRRTRRQRTTASHQSKRQQHEHGGVNPVSIYPGFCGPPPNLSQCMFAEDAANGATSSTPCLGGRKRRSSCLSKKQPQRVRGGANPVSTYSGYSGFCGPASSTLSQCMFAESVDASPSTPCMGGRKRHNMYNFTHKRKGGKQLFDNLNILNKTQFKQKMKQYYQSYWYDNATELLQKVIRHHMNEIVEHVREDKDTNNHTTQKALENVLHTYAI